uniref:Uncharacterized protein n=1 Tax=Arundo donax TaxID=35708 RepID=A0A0A8XW88_ARUDO
MLNVFFIKKIFNMCNLEFTFIITPHFFDLHFKFILGSSYKSFEHHLSFTLVMKKKNPSETRIIINND